MVTRLLLISSLRFLRAHAWQTGLALTGVALGVSIVVSVDLANQSARRALALSVDAVSGNSTHQIVGGPRGINEDLYVRFRADLGIQRATPIIQDSVKFVGQHFTLTGLDPVSLLASSATGFRLMHTNGVDWINQANSILVSRRKAKLLGIRLNEETQIEYRGKRHEVRVSGFFDSDNQAATDGFLLADISVAQELLERGGRIDRIDLRLRDNEPQIVRHWLPAGLQLIDAKARDDTLSEISNSFHIDLAAMSMLALLVGGLIICNTVSLSVLQRRRHFGLFRHLGVTSGEILRLIVLEAAFLGVFGTVAGLAVGIAIAHGLIGMVTRSINDLYYPLRVSQLHIDYLTLIKGCLLGVGTVMAATLVPAIEAARIPPVTVLQRSALESRSRHGVLKLLFFSVLLGTCGMVLIALTERSLVAAFIAIALLVLGYALAIPSILLLFNPLANTTVSSAAGVIGRTALRSIPRSLSRTGLAVSALTISISASIAVAVMIASFRDAVSSWLHQSLTGDFYLSVPARNGGNSYRPLPPLLVRDIERMPDLMDVTATRSFELQTPNGAIRAIAYESEHTGTTRFKIKESVPSATELFKQATGVFVSEPYAYRNKIRAGDQMRLYTGAGELSVPVLAIFRDYRSTQGLMVMDRALYERLWQDATVSGLIIRLYPETDKHRVESAMRARIAKEIEPIQITASAEIREAALATFDRTFTVTDVLRLLTVLVAFVGVFGALMSIQLERQREFGMMRAIGATPGQILSATLIQTGLIGIVAGFLAIPLGLAMAEILIGVINQRAFGWSMERTIPVFVLFDSLFLSMAAALGAGIYPAICAMRGSPSEVLRSE